MRISALTRKSWTDLTRRRARAIFAIATLGMAIGSIGIFALTPLMNKAMSKEVQSNKLYDVQLQTAPLYLTDSNVVDISALPNVKAVATRGWFMTRIFIGDRREKAVVMSVPDFARQNVDIVAVASGTAPSTGGVLVDVQNSRKGVYDAGAGEIARVVTSTGSVRSLKITGEGRSLMGSGPVASGYAVLYADPETFEQVTGSKTVGSIELRLFDQSSPAAKQTVSDVRQYLKTRTSFTAFTALPQIREPGTWPGKDIIDQLGRLFYVITVLALISGLFLISNTMSTLVSEQTSEIGIMKAIGGSRRQIAASYVRTAGLMGALGCLFGIPLGILISNLLTRFFADTFFGVSAPFAVDPKVTLIAIAVGLIGPALASLPAIRRATAVPVRQALTSGAGEAGSDGAADRLLRRIRILPRDAQIGIRSLGRRKRRTAGTTILVALAVANLLALLALGKAAADVGAQYWKDANYQVSVFSDDAGSGRPFTHEAGELIAGVDGVKHAQPVISSLIKMGTRDTFLWALPADSMLHERLANGRLFTPDDRAHASRVVLVEKGLAGASGVHVGDTVQLNTAAGVDGFRVVGLLDNSSGVMGSVFTPLETAQDVLGMGLTANQYWIQTTSLEHAAIDRTTTRIEDTLLAHGYSAGTQVSYAEERLQQSFTRSITTAITVLGFIVVGISLIGLVNAMTANVLERTREIGVLRCIGARSKDIRRIFATEGMAVSLMGWFIGIPLGYLAAVVLLRIVESLLDLQMPFVFPLWNAMLALAGTIVLALLVMVMPLRRATRFHAGDALRYQ